MNRQLNTEIPIKEDEGVLTYQQQKRKALMKSILYMLCLWIVFIGACLFFPLFGVFVIHMIFLTIMAFDEDEYMKKVTN